MSKHAHRAPQAIRASGRESETKPSSGATNEAMNAAYSILAFSMNRYVIDHMLRSARRFGGDFERLILWGVVAHLNVAHLLPPGSLPSAVLDEAGLLPAAQDGLRPLMLRDIAQITGIPRETARRKLQSLQRDGWLVQTDEGWLLNLERDVPEPREFTLESIRRFMQTARVMQAAVDDATNARRGGGASMADG